MESSEQRDFVKWFRETYPGHRKSLRVSMAGLPRYGRKGAVQWNMMKSQGLEKGEADIVIALPRGQYGALVIEHKGDGMSREVTEEQSEYLKYHAGIGNFAISTRGLEELQQVVQDYMGLNHGSQDTNL